MKKCPDKKLLYSLDDPELSLKERVALESHLQKCPGCQAEIEAYQAAEENFKADALIAFVPGIIKNAAMQQIRLEVKPAKDRFAKKKLNWFWIFAPGLAIILFAALFNAQQPPRHHQAMVGCYASAENSRVNEKAVEFGHQIALQNLPLKLDGNFVFTLVATQTSSFEHSGQSELVAARFDRIEFRNASAAFTLLSGNQMSVMINGEIKEIDICPLRTSTNKYIKPVQTGPAETVQNSQSAPATLPADLGQDPASATTMPDHVASETGAASSPVAGSAITENAHVEENVNPFLDKPLKLNGN